jgi:hypothetical protein
VPPVDGLDGVDGPGGVDGLDEAVTSSAITSVYGFRTGSSTLTTLNST